MARKLASKGRLDLLMEAALVCKQKRTSIRRRRRIYLPPELVDHICSYLHDDIEALRQVSLVCRLWSSCSSPYLFVKAGIPICPHTWEGTAGSRAECFCGLSHDEGRVVNMRQQFMDTSRFWGVRDLRMFCTWIPPNNMKRAITLKRYPIQPTEFQGLLESLPRLRSLELSLEYVPSFPRHPSPLNGPRKLERLTFNCRQGVPFDPTPAMDILHLFHEITSLEFHKLPDPVAFERTIQNSSDPLSIHVSCRDVNPPQPLVPFVESVELSQSSSSSVALALSYLSRNINMESLTKLSLSKLHFRPEEVLREALPDFLSICPNLESMTCDPALFRFMRGVVLPNLRELNVHGKLRFDEPQHIYFHVPGEPDQILTSVSVARSGWLDFFYAIPYLVTTPSLENICLHFDLCYPQLSQATSNRASWGKAETNLLDTLHSTVTDFWSFLDRLVGRAKSTTMHMEFHIPTRGGRVSDKERFLEILRIIAESRMSQTAKDAVVFYAS